MKNIIKNCTSSVVLFVFIVVLASLFRLPLMQYVEFKGDESLNLFLATRPLFHHPFPPGSLASSAGILNFPLINYLLFPIVIFTTYPPAVSFVIACINVFAIGGFFLLFKKYHGKLTALLASGIIALSPWAILYSRKIWAQDFILPLMLPFLLSVYRILDGKKKFWIIFGFSSMLLVQIHQVTGLIPVLFFAAFVIKKQSIAWKNLFIGIGLGCIPAIPYLWYMMHNSCITCHQTTFLARFMYHDMKGFFRPLQIISLGDFHTELGNDFAIFATQFRLEYLASKLTYLAYILLPVSFVYFWIKNLRYRFFVGISILPVILYFLLGLQPLMHYYIALIPFFALFVAYTVASLIQNKKLTIVAIALSALYFFGLILFDYGIFAFLAQKGGFAGDYGSGYKNSNVSIASALAPFKNYPNYKELVIIEPTPLDLFQGYMPIGKMIFPYAELKRNEANLEKQFLKTPTNPLYRREILAYYTQQRNPSWDYILTLKEKSRKIDAFSFIYKRVLEEYLETRFKNLYENPDFLLLYPRHWHEETTANGTVLSDGDVSVIIAQLPPSFQPKPFPKTQDKIVIDGQTTYGTICKEKSLWCGISYQPIFLRSRYYAFAIQTSAATLQNNQSMHSYAVKVFREIIRSVRILQ